MSRIAQLALAAMVGLSLFTLNVVGRSAAVAQVAEPKVEWVAFRYCKFHDRQTGIDHLGLIFGETCGPSTALGQVSYTTCEGTQLTVDRGQLRTSEVACDGAREAPDESTYAILGKVQFVSADGQSVSISYATKTGASTINVPAGLIGGQAKKGSEIVVLPTAGGQSKEALAKQFSRFKTLLDAGTPTKGKEVGIQLQVKR